MRFTLTIDCDNAAFADDPLELAHCLERVSDNIAEYFITGVGTVRDSNGNTVGSWSVTA